MRSRLTSEEHGQLEHTVRAERSPARVTTCARILLKTDEGWSASNVAQALDVARNTVRSETSKAEATWAAVQPSSALSRMRVLAIA